MKDRSSPPSRSWGYDDADPGPIGESHFFDLWLRDMSRTRRRYRLASLRLLVEIRNLLKGR